MVRALETLPIVQGAFNCNGITHFNNVRRCICLGMAHKETVDSYEVFVNTKGVLGVFVKVCGLSDASLGVLFPAYRGSRL